MYTVLTVPNKLLFQKAKPLQEITSKTVEILERMLETMYRYQGIGLAANQVGILQRLVVLDLETERDKNPQFFINPQITWVSTELAPYSEGCLSIPEIYRDIERPTEIKLSYWDIQGKEHHISVSGLLATVLQHECDHLNGVLFIDHLSRLKRNTILQKCKKNLQNP